MTDAALPAHCTQAEFARLNGWGKSYVTKLKGEGRLVFDESGRVDVQASLAKIRETTGAPERASAPVVGGASETSRSRKDHYDAEMARLAYEKEVGQVLIAAEVLDAVTDAATRLRNTLETWPAQLAPQLATLVGDEARIRLFLADHVHRALAELARGFGKLSAERAAPH